MSEYADITLLECNRKQSINNETLSNPSLWTNRMGEVIELKVGDRVSIEAGFINQRGCANPSSIEFKGKSLEVEGTFNYSQDNLPSITQSDQQTIESTINQYSSVLFSNKTNQDKNIELKDNEVNIEVSYYKNLNGENHILLPRKHLNAVNASSSAANSAEKFFTTTEAAQDTHTDNTYNKGLNSGRVFYTPETFDSTRPFFDPNDSIDLRYFNPNDYGVFYKSSTGAATFIPASYRPDGQNLNVFNKKILNIKPRIDNSRMTMFSRDFFFSQISSELKIEVPNDSGTGTTTITSDQYWKQSLPAAIRERLWRYVVLKGHSPAFFEYSENKDLITLKIDKGFSSPQSIAEQLTQQLQEETEDSPEVFNRTSQYGTTTPLSYVNKSRTFKTYNGANYGDFNKTNYDHFEAATANDESFNWNRVHNNIFVKRADLFTAGRAVNNWFGYVGYTKTEADGSKKYYDNFDYDSSNGANYNMGKPNFIRNSINYLKKADNSYYGNYIDPITTSWEWNDINLKRLNNLFKVQGQYPELFKNMKTSEEDEGKIWFNDIVEGNDLAGNPIPVPTHPTIDNARFLHMNRFDYDGTGYYWLGDDGYYKHTYTQTIDPAKANAGFNIDHRTLPIFFKYQPENADKYINSPNINNLCYGFATKIRDGDIDYIQIHPEAPHSQGIVPAFFEYRAGFHPANNSEGAWGHYPIQANKCIIGWDYSFNSWGNVCMLGYTGLNLKSYSGDYESGIGDDFNDMLQAGSGTTLSQNLKSCCIGANNPAIVYDAVSGKFGFKDLHIPEKIGQQFNAGQTTTIDGTDPPISKTIPIVADAGSECYKINKRFRADSFCPDLDGEEKGFTIEGNTETINASKSNVMTFSFFNSRVQPYTIFDSHMGVNLNLGNTFKISDINRQPEIWKNGLMGLLGFSYNQFNPSTINEKNRGDARVDFRNILSLHKPTTNSEVLNTDIQNYSMNPYGAINYNPSISTPLNIPTFYKDGGTLTNISYFPAIVQDTKSITIEGELLPKLVQRPYLTIRSDILSQNKYIGGSKSGLNLPIIAVINKINADKDFIQVADTSFNYTITRPTKFSEITTAITDPDGQLSDTEEGNAIIYKITRNGDLTNFDIIAQILNKKK